MKKDFSFAQIVENTNDIVIVTDTRIDDPGPIIIYVNEAFTRLTGYTAEEAIGNNPRMLQSENSDNATRQEIRSGLEQNADIRTRILNISKNGNEYWLDLHIIPLYDDRGCISHYAAIERDITEQVLREQQLEHQANIDSLSGLLNKSAFNSLLQQQLGRFQQTDRSFALLMIDLDYFKSINDEYGHVTGDKVIEAVGRVCHQLIRDYDIAARVGGEEFCCLLDNVDAEEARAAAERMRTMVNNVRLDSTAGDLNLTVSIGVAMVSNPHGGTEAVIEKADRALYQAKRAGRNRTVVVED